MSSKLIESRAAKWGLLVSFVAVFALMSGLYLPGCSQNPTTSSDLNLSQDETNFFELPFDESALAKKVTDPTVDVEIALGEGLVTVDGGGVIEVGTKHLFTVAPMSVYTNTLISAEITRIEEDGIVTAIYEFGPHGTVFSLPAVLQIDAKTLFDKGTKSINFYYLNEQTNLWELQGQYPVDDNGYAHVPVYHFSKYGASR
ncbi:MAG: hypothetical protein AB1483_02495 [Candidatus Zixiibacteriota bacterium]